MICNKTLRRALALISIAPIVALAYALPTNPVFIIIGYLWTLVFVLPEIYRQ